MRFFCQNCQTCICRDCAILDHRDHNIFSLEQGLENKKSEIEAKMRKVQDSGSRLKIHRDTLEKRRLKVNSSIEEATSEVKRVAERCISMIHEHETSVTEQLVEQKASFQKSSSVDRVKSEPESNPSPSQIDRVIGQRLVRDKKYWELICRSPFCTYSCTAAKMAKMWSKSHRSYKNTRLQYYQKYRTGQADFA